MSLEDLTKFLISDAYKAGAASRQAEVDELQEKVNREREEATEYFTDLEYSNAKCKELQKRIDEALELLNASSEHRTQVPVGRLFWILKGK